MFAKTASLPQFSIESLNNVFLTALISTSLILILIPANPALANAVHATILSLALLAMMATTGTIIPVFLTVLPKLQSKVETVYLVQIRIARLASWVTLTIA
jgi:archaellum biogenesis protein FlaJ (TadC family)